MGKSARKVAGELKVSRTAYNNFANHQGKPQDRVKRPIAELYLKVRREKLEEGKQKEAETHPVRRAGELKHVAEPPAEYGPSGTGDDLRRIVPKGRKAALLWVDDVLLPWIDREYPPDADPEPPAAKQRGGKK